MIKKYLKNLTTKQREIVLAPAGPIRVIAGPGSGKTRILTHRLAHLIFEGFDPNKILALTFTNMAAREMLNRTETLLENKYSTPQILTYHSFCHHFLKYWGEIENIKNELTWDRKYEIMDGSAQKSLLKRIYRDLKINYSDLPYRMVQNYIISKKRDVMFNEPLPMRRKITSLDKKIYYYYVEHQKNMNLLDFDDLILVTRKILEDYIDVRKRWQDKIAYLLVDEYQDTSTDQAIIVRNLINPNFNNIFVVGDPFQTIYTWRGAKSIYLTQGFKKLFPSVVTYSMIENFRSTKKIITTANVIRQKIIDLFDEEQHENLISMKDEEGEIIHKHLDSDAKQAKYVVDKIRNIYTQKKALLRDIAILYRTNKESLQFEKELKLKALPYKVHGAFAFFKRVEVLDAIAYLDLISNTASDMQMERIIASPRKGIGPKTLEKIYKLTRIEKKPIKDILLEKSYLLNLSKKSENKLNILKRALDKARHEIKLSVKKVGDIFRDFLMEIEYFGIYQGKLEEDERKENLEELIDDINRSFEDDKMNLEQYLDKLKLLDSNEEINNKEYISLMTFHKAKGKEYKYVFVVGLNEGNFPSKTKTIMSEFNDEEIREEWRLFYVAITRSKSNLFLTSYDPIYRNYEPSRFLTAISYLFENEPKKTLSPPSPFKKISFFKNKNQDTNDIQFQDYFKIGNKVIHRTFGKGIVKGDLNKFVLVEFNNFGKIKISKNQILWKKG